MPVVLALVRAVAEPEFGLHGCTASTGGSAPFVVVNGPDPRARIGMHATHNALANGSRANATIGRALRLIVLNVLGGVPGQLDRSTLGHPGKFTFCVAEDEEGSAVAAAAADRGVPAGASAVTVLAAESPHQIMNEWTTDPREILETYAAAIRANMLTYSIWAGNYALVMAPQQREILAAAGWSKKDVRDCVFERARVTRRRVAHGGQGGGGGAARRGPASHRAPVARRSAGRRRRRAGGRLRRDRAAVVRRKSLAVTEVVHEGRPEEK